jgi:acyl-CoA synthetase (AMP-forming)/AMP-acid ligase II
MTRSPTAHRDLTLGAIVCANAARTPEMLALHAEGRSFTYAELAGRIRRVAWLAQAMGVRAGDIVVLAAPNCAQYFEIVLGVSALGAAVATLNPKMTGSEFSTVLADCSPRLVILHPACLNLRDTAAKHSSALLVLDAEYEESLAQAAALELPQTSETAAFAVSYTSGTTGKPKGVLLSHRSRALSALAMASEYGCFGPRDTFLAATPLFHGAGFAYALANLYLGGAVTVLPSPDTGAMMGHLRGTAITGVFVAPTILSRLIEAARDGASLGPQLKAIICNAAACPQSLKERAVAAFGPGLLHETYGSTEAGIVTNLRPEDQLRTNNSCGRAFLHMEISLRDAQGAEVATGAIGELHARGPTGFLGYLGKPQETRETIRDGWVSVGDLARRDENGYYHIVDRLKDMIVTGGENVYPREVENVISTLLGVVECAVVGALDTEWGERVEAFVVRQAGARIEADDVLEFCRARLSPAKRPKTILFVDALPRNATGKILKAELRARQVRGADAIRKPPP